MTRSTLAILETSAGLIALPLEQLDAARRLAQELLQQGDAGFQTPMSPSSSNSRLLTAGEAAAALSVSASWLLQRAREGRVPHVRFGKYVRFDLDDVRMSFSKSNAENKSQTKRG